MTPAKCTVFIQGVENRTDRIILFLRRRPVHLGYSLWFWFLQLKWDKKELERKMWLLCANNKQWDLPLLNFSFLIYKRGLRGNEKEERWGVGVVNKIPLGSNGQWFIGQHIRARLYLEREERAVSGKISDFVAFESRKVNRGKNPWNP